MLNLDDRLIKEVSPKIGPNALSALLAIAIHLNQKTNRCFPSHNRLMELTGMGRDAVYTALSVLQKHGLLKVEQRVDSKKKQFTRRTFRVSTRFISVFVNAADLEPLPENPDTAQPYTAQPDTGNPETYQINESQQINEFEQIRNVGQTAPQAAFPSTPPPETEIQTAVTVGGEIGALEAAVFQNPAGPPPPPAAGQKTRRAAKAETTTAEILSHLKGEVVDYFHAIHAAWQEWSRYKADEKRSRYKPQGAARTITALFNETGGDAELGREAIRFSMEKNWAGIFMPKQSDKHAAPAQRYSLADRPQCEHTPDGLLAELRAFYTASTGLLCAAQEYAGTKYGANDLKAIIQKFCANQVGKGRCANTFEQHHADLSAWLLNQKKFEQQANQGPKDNNPYSNRPDGPKTRSDVNPYARHKIIS